MRFYDDGVAPRKNATVMAEAMEQYKEAGGADAMDEDDAEMAEPEPVEEKPKKKKKKRSAVRLCHPPCLTHVSVEAGVF